MNRRTIEAGKNLEDINRNIGEFRPKIVVDDFAHKPSYFPSLSSDSHLPNRESHANSRQAVNRR